MSTGKFFVIRSKMNELVLDIEGQDATPGAKVITWNYSGTDNQLWFQDYIAKVIRSKLDDNLVLEMQDDILIVNEYQPDEYNQKWKVTMDRITHVENNELVLDIFEANPEPGAQICSYEFSGADNQLWSIEYQEPKYAFIHSKNPKHSGKVINVCSEEAGEGAKCILYDRKTPDHKDGIDNQLFYEDKYGIIHSKMDDLVFDTADEKLQMQSYDTDAPNRQYVYSGGKIVLKNKTNRCLQIKDHEKMKPFGFFKIEEDDYQAQPHQKWWFEYVNYT